MTMFGNNILSFRFLGTWTAAHGLNLSRTVELPDFDNTINVMANKTFIVTMVKTDPYVMLKQEVRCRFFNVEHSYN